MFVTQEALNHTHSTSAMCWRGTESKQWELVVVDTEEQMGFFLGMWYASDSGAIIQALGMHYTVHKKIMDIDGA